MKIKSFFPKQIKPIKQLCVVLVLLLVGAAGCGLLPNDSVSPEQDIVILYTNDVHCAVDTGIGYAGLVSLEQEYQAAGAEVLLVDCGDAIQGEPIGTISRGMYIIDIMNQIGIDVAAIGNHEFDYGAERFLELAQHAQFPYVSSNFRYIDSGETVFAPYTIMEAGGVNIAFVGISTPETLTASAPVYFQDGDGNFLYSFDQKQDGSALYASVQQAVDAARKDGADLVVALSHLGANGENKAWSSGAVIANTNGIDVVLDGHSHEIMACERVENKDGDKVLLSQTGTKFASVGVLLIQQDGSIGTELIYEHDGVDNTTKTFIEGIQSEFADELQTVVAKTSVDLTILDVETGKRRVRNGETNIANLCADAYRLLTGADVAIVNGGGVRDNIAAGEITYEDILKVHPFGNAVCVIEATGQELLDALEMGARLCPEENGDFLQVSGITYTIDTAVPSHVVLTADGLFAGVDGAYRVKNVMVQGEPLDLTTTYTLASHDYFLKKGGGGFVMFMDNVMLQDSIMLDNQILIRYITEYLGGNVGEAYAHPYGEGRIIIQ